MIKQLSINTTEKPNNTHAQSLFLFTLYIRLALVARFSLTRMPYKTVLLLMNKQDYNLKPQSFQLRYNCIPGGLPLSVENKRATAAELDALLLERLIAVSPRYKN